ncbi:sel1 repeat family protein [Mesorhizobium sp. M0145]
MGRSMSGKRQCLNHGFRHSRRVQAAKLMGSGDVSPSGGKMMKSTRFVVSLWFSGLLFVIALFSPTASQGGAIEAEAAFKASNYQVAYNEWKELAENGDAIAEFNLGFLYSKGLGVPMDYSKAAEWWTKAAKQNMAVAQVNLGLLYSWGKGVQRDDAKAAELWHGAATQGIPEAQQYLG